MTIINFHMVPNMGQKPSGLVAFGQKLVGLYIFSIVRDSKENIKKVQFIPNYLVISFNISIEQSSADILRAKQALQH